MLELLALNGGLACLILLAAADVASPAPAEERSCRGTLNKVTVDQLRVPQNATCKLKGTVIRGSVKVERNVTSSRITHGIQYDANKRRLKANGNKVGGSIQVIGNAGGAELFRKVVNGDLQCKENRPAPTGANNVVGGNKEDQCARF